MYYAGFGWPARQEIAATAKAAPTTAASASTSADAEFARPQGC